MFFYGSVITIGHLPILACGLILVSIDGPKGRAMATRVSTVSTFECGRNALYLLAHLEDRNASFDTIESALSARHPDGYSMEELAKTASAIGFKLDGVRFRKGDPPLDRPAIAFLKDAKSGHFIVLRPVGSTGTMVQFMDPPHAPRIIDYAYLFKMPSWTGRILIRADPWPIRHAAPLLAGAAGLVVVAALVGWRWRLGRAKVEIGNGPTHSELIPRGAARP